MFVPFAVGYSKKMLCYELVFKTEPMLLAKVCVTKSCGVCVDSDFDAKRTLTSTRVNVKIFKKCFTFV